MHSGPFLLLVFCTTAYVAVAKPSSKVAETQSQAEASAQSNAQTSTRSVQKGGDGGFSQLESVSTSSSNASASSESQSESRYHQLFKFVHEQQINRKEEFEQLRSKLEKLIEQQYSEALNQLKQWNQIPELAEHEKEAEEGLRIAKDQLLQITQESGSNFLTKFKDCQGGQNHQQQIQEYRQQFEAEIRESLVYFIKALSGINSLNFGSGSQKEGRCLRGGKRKLGTRSIGSGIIDTGKGMIGKAIDSGKGMMDSGMEMGQRMVKKGADCGGKMMNKGASFAGSTAESGAQVSEGMFNKARGFGESAAETATGFGGQMMGGGSGKVGPKGHCEKEPHGGKGPQGGKGQGGQGGEVDMNYSSSQAASGASAETFQKTGTNGDDMYSKGGSSARAYAGAESKSGSISV